MTAPIEAAKVREVRFDAKANTLYTIKEGVLVGQALVQVEIKTGRRDSLLVALPSEGVKPLNWQFPSKAKEPEVAKSVKAPAGYTAYELKFTQALEGVIQLDVEFEMLLDKNVDYNAVDSLGRTPLHYAFCKMAPGDEASRDPIEIVTRRKTA